MVIGTTLVCPHSFVAAARDLLSLRLRGRGHAHLPVGHDGGHAEEGLLGAVGLGDLDGGGLGRRSQH